MMDEGSRRNQDCRTLACPFIFQPSSFILRLTHGSSLTVQYLLSVAMISMNAWSVTGLRM